MYVTARHVIDIIINPVSKPPVSYKCISDTNITINKNVLNLLLSQ